ncbi:YjjG family noncanonical pyrimidine nucleotidase [Kriegella aquimaris]|uniref:Putative hydrolase of the HAD superfamily n=1 Tax=Kriegella aquimaris TaxID=192904 RepID=A0A1G9VTV7_9FLAO|nr:YjjG family noncanonical pyrimidine nucleotidase [Kriegella aquimaris]SDM75668.1 putative hydrolase of the HAD superfamily [Kriegella aquimaris]
MYKEVVTDIFFDLDHTLWDFDKNSALTFGKIFKDNGIDVDLSDFLRVYVPKNLAYWKLYREEKITKEALRYERLKTVFDELAYVVPDDTIHVLSEDYIVNLSSFDHLLPYTIEVLDYLSPNYKLHIITNGFKEIQEKKLRGSKIHGYFDQVVDSEMAGVKKPNPLIFEIALRGANVRPQNALMIGDNLEADILGAKAVGFHAIHFNAHNEPVHEICQMIHDLREIKTYL